MKLNNELKLGENAEENAREAQVKTDYTVRKCGKGKGYVHDIFGKEDRWKKVRYKLQEEYLS